MEMLHGLGGRIEQAPYEPLPGPVTGAAKARVGQTDDGEHVLANVFQRVCVSITPICPGWVVATTG